ncbi:MAG: BON domain-containing protein [Nitrospira sp.]|nr:BON domain-containing protein [Nitrospira sp.]MCC7473696.1 BON domain-containing protein [Candidatus Nomurabacteria bacterium]
MPMRMMQAGCAIGVFTLAVTSGLWGMGSVAWAEQAPEGKQETPPAPKAKDPEVKAKDPDPKPREADVKSKDPEPKPTEQKAKDSDAKVKETESKGKDVESKPKDAEPKAKAKESEHKAKEAEQKPKESEAKPKDAETVAEHPCPSVPHLVEAKPAAEAQAPASDPAAGDRQKAAEPEAKKPVRSSMVTAKLALMADPRLFPYDIEVDAKDKDLVLLGKVGQESDKRVATDIVRCLEGVHAVENRLKIEADAAHSLLGERDKIITQLVKERFEKSKTLQSVKFDVKTEDGIVSLTGATRFQIIVLEAAQAARQIPGVRAVNTDAVRLVAGE